MSSSLVSVLHQEERSLVAELRASKPFQRLEGIRRLLALYDAQPSIATGLDVPAGSERGSGEVIHFAATPPAAPASSATTNAQAAVHAAAAVAPPAAPPVAEAPKLAMGAIPMPGPTLTATAPAVMAEADVMVHGVAASAPIGMNEPESSSVVSSVRAALLGIGKN